jgi:hypothetical protein
MLRLLLDIITCRAGGFIQMCWLVRRFSFFFFTDRYSISNVSKSDAIGRRNFFFSWAIRRRSGTVCALWCKSFSWEWRNFFLVNFISNGTIQRAKFVQQVICKIYFNFFILSSIENRSPYIPIHHSSSYIINVKPECCSRPSICLCCIQSGFATTKNTHTHTRIQHNRLWWWLSQRPSFFLFSSPF